MSMLDTLWQYNHEFAEAISQFFAWYNIAGRQMLDVLHNVFDSIFNFLLIITIMVSLLYLVMSVYILLQKKRHKKEDELKEELPFVTVQIPTFNELAAIRCAEACLTFDYPKDKYEIIIGDDSSNPKISKKLREFAKANNIKYAKRASNIGYKPGNLNNMLNHSRGEILVIFDSDFVPDEGFLLKMVKPFLKDKKVAGVQARWNFMNANQNMVSALGATILSVYHHINIPFMCKKRKITLLCGSAEAVRKDVLLKLGAWENGNLTEDIEFSLRLLEKGYKIEYLDDLECNSEVPYTLKDLYRQQMRWAYGVTYSWKKHFLNIFRSKYLKLSDKLYMVGIFCSGYFVSMLLAGLFITGILSFITHRPAPIEWGKLIYELVRNVILTSGLIIAGIISLSKSNKSKLTFRMIASSFSYGIVVTYYVNVGILKAFAKIPMQWYMLNKQGNKIA